MNTKAFSYLFSLFSFPSYPIAGHTYPTFYLDIFGRYMNVFLLVINLGYLLVFYPLLIFYFLVLAFLPRTLSRNGWVKVKS